MINFSDSDCIITDCKEGELPTVLAEHFEENIDKVLDKLDTEFRINL